MQSFASTIDDINPVSPDAKPKRLALVSMVGTTLEYHDFTIYNAMAALVFSQLFFPSVDPIAGTMLAFSLQSVICRVHWAVWYSAGLATR